MVLMLRIVWISHIQYGANNNSCNTFHTEGILQIFSSNEFGYCSTSSEACEHDVDNTISTTTTTTMNSSEGLFDCKCIETNEVTGKYDLWGKWLFQIKM